MSGGVIRKREYQPRISCEGPNVLTSNHSVSGVPAVFDSMDFGKKKKKKLDARSGGAVFIAYIGLLWLILG